MKVSWIHRDKTAHGSLLVLLWLLRKKKKKRCFTACNSAFQFPFEQDSCCLSQWNLDLAWSQGFSLGHMTWAYFICSDFCFEESGWKWKEVTIMQRILGVLRKMAFWKLNRKSRPEDGGSHWVNMTHGKWRQGNILMKLKGLGRQRVQFLKDNWYQL